MRNEIPDFTQDEVQAAIDNLKKSKASDNHGIRAEDIKTCDETTKEMIRQIFNEVLKQEDCTPKTWRRNTYKSDLQKRNVEEVGIYRPICTLPALYKLFSTIIYNRLYYRLDQAQSEDQGGCRPSYQALDHLATHRLLEQKCREWCIKMWVATVDFMKAFDSISQQCLWNVLEKCGIESHHINLLRRPFAEQKGTVSTDKESDMFEMKRGTKQGDPLCSLLFNTVLQKALTDVLVLWPKSKGIGTRLGGYESDCLTNLRFADDVLLFTTSLAQLQK